MVNAITQPRLQGATILARPIKGSKRPRKIVENSSYF